MFRIPSELQITITVTFSFSLLKPLHSSMSSSSPLEKLWEYDVASYFSFNQSECLRCDEMFGVIMNVRGKERQILNMQEGVPQDRPRASDLTRDKQEAARRTVQCCSAVVCAAHLQTKRSEWGRQSVDPWLELVPADAPHAPYETAGIFYRSQHSRWTKTQRLQ